jgi:hypothetical protein
MQQRHSSRSGCRSSFNHLAHSLCVAQEISESQILNANLRSPKIPT